MLQVAHTEEALNADTFHTYLYMNLSMLIWVFHDQPEEALNSCSSPLTNHCLLCFDHTCIADLLYDDIALQGWFMITKATRGTECRVHRPR